jgi:anti-sigma B factor antagonist
MTKKELVFAAQELGAARVYRLSGWLYGTTGGYAFQEEIRQAVADGGRRFVVDLSGVQRIDSCGIGILAASIFSAQRAGGGIVLASLPEQVRRVLGVTMFLDHVAHADTLDDALAKVASMGV